MSLEQNQINRQESRETLFASAVVFVIIMLLFGFVYEDLFMGN